MSEMFDPEDAEQAQKAPLEDSELEEAAGGMGLADVPFDPED